MFFFIRIGIWLIILIPLWILKLKSPHYIYRKLLVLCLRHIAYHLWSICKVVQEVFWSKLNYSTEIGRIFPVRWGKILIQIRQNDTRLRTQICAIALCPKLWERTSVLSCFYVQYRMLIVSIRYIDSVLHCVPPCSQFVQSSGCAEGDSLIFQPHFSRQNMFLSGNFQRDLLKYVIYAVPGGAVICGLLVAGLLPPPFGGCEWQDEQNLLGGGPSNGGGRCQFPCKFAGHQLIADSFVWDRSSRRSGRASASAAAMFLR
jgi:hypothetical protein